MFPGVDTERAALPPHVNPGLAGAFHTLLAAFQRGEVDLLPSRVHSEPDAVPLEGLCVTGEWVETLLSCQAPVSPCTAHLCAAST